MKYIILVHTNCIAVFSIQCIVRWRKSYGAYTGNSSPAHNPPKPFPDNNLGLFEVLKTPKTLTKNSLGLFEVLNTPKTLPRQQSWSFSSSQNPQNTSQTTILVSFKFSMPPKHLPENSFGLFEVLKTLKTLPRHQSWSF